MADKTFSYAGVNYLWSTAGNWDGGTVPADNQSVEIPALQSCIYDADWSNAGTYPNGINTLTVNGTLSMSLVTSSYLKIKAAATITGTGTFNVGTSGAGNNVPFAVKHTITGGNAWYINGALGLAMNVYAAEPVIKTVVLSGAESAGATVLEYNAPSLVGDIWADGDTIQIDNVNKALNSESRVIAAGGVAAGSITITVGLTDAKIAGTLIHLISRNVKFTGVGAAGFVCRNFTTGKLIIAGGQWTTANYRMISSCTGMSISGGTFSGNSYGLYSCTGASISGGVFSGNGYDLIYCTGASISGGVFSGNGYVLIYCTGASISGGVFSGNVTGLYSCTGTSISGGVFSGNSSGLNYCTGASISGGVFSGNGSGLDSCTANIANTTFSLNTNDINLTDGQMRYCVISTNGGYGLLSKTNIMQSLDHNQTLGAFKSWTDGGVTSSQAVTVPTGFTQANQTVLESASYPGFWQRDVIIPKGQKTKITVYLRKSAAMAVLPKAELFKKGNEPLLDATCVVQTFTMTDSTDAWEQYTWTVTGGTYNEVYTLRFSGQNATGSVFSEAKIAVPEQRKVLVTL